MTALFLRVGIDYSQWKALLRAALKMDLRGSSLGGSAFGAHNKQLASVLVPLAFYGAMGAFSSMLIWWIRDEMLSATLILTYVMFMVGAMVLLDQHSVITSPNDYPVLGFRPISSRTYFAVRLANVLVYTLALTTAFGLIPMVTFAIAGGFQPLRGLGAVVAFYLAAIFVTLVLVAAYAWLLRGVGAQRMKRWLGYLQLAMGFGIYGGYFLSSQLVDQVAISTLTLPETPLMLLYPPTWFASFISLAQGHMGWRVLLPATCSVVVIVWLATMLSGRLSMHYSEELGALAADTDAQRAQSPKQRRPFWFVAAEGRAISLLVRAQFRNDQKFRMAVLGLLPLTILYLFMSLRHGPLPDPFIVNWKRSGDTMLLTLAVLMFPTTLRLNLTMSDAFRASWIYYTAPIERGRLVRATTDVIAVFFLLPYLLLVDLLLTWFIGNVIHATVHVVFLGLVSYLMLQLAVLADPALPFSRATQKSSRSGIVMVTVVAGVVGGAILVPVLGLLVYVSWVRIGVALAALAGAIAGVNALTRVRVEAQAANLEFLG